MAQESDKEVSKSDIADFAGRKIKEGALKLGDIAGVVGEKAAQKVAELITLPVRKAIDFASWEAKMGTAAYNRLMIALEDKIREERVNEQLAKK